MNTQTHLNRLARRDLLSALWAELEAEEHRAKGNRKKMDWRKVLRTKAMREDRADRQQETTCRS